MLLSAIIISKDDDLHNFLFLDLDSILDLLSPFPLFGKTKNNASYRELNSLQDRVTKFVDQEYLVILFY